MTTVESLKSVLCGPDGKCCIAGSDADRKTVDDALDAMDAQAQRIVELEALSVTNIMIGVVPGDGSGCEVYAKSVADVESKLSSMGEELEDWQMGIKRHYLLEKGNATLRAELDALRGQEPVGDIVEDANDSGRVRVSLNSDARVQLQVGANVYAAPVAPDQPAQSIHPERDTSKPAEAQGLFHKFDVRRSDGSDQPGGKHHGCEYFVLDVDHDPHAKAALQAYATACAQSHPQLSADLIAHHGAAQPIQAVNAERCCQHDSDCAVYNMPAYPAGPCDCSLQTVAWVSVAKGDVSKALLYFNVNEEIKPLGVIGEATTRTTLANAKAAQQKGQS